MPSIQKLVFILPVKKISQFYKIPLLIMLLLIPKHKELYAKMVLTGHKPISLSHDNPNSERAYTFWENELKVTNLSSYDSIPKQKAQRGWSLSFGNRLLVNEDRSVSFGNYISFGWKIKASLETGIGLGHFDFDLFPDARIYPIYVHTSWNPGRFNFRPILSAGIGTNMVQATENFYFWQKPQTDIENGLYGHIESGISYKFAKGESFRFLLGLQFHHFALNYRLNESYSETYKFRLIKFYLSIVLSI